MTEVEFNPRIKSSGQTFSVSYEPRPSAKKIDDLIPY